MARITQECCNLLSFTIPLFGFNFQHLLVTYETVTRKKIFLCFTFSSRYVQWYFQFTLFKAKLADLPVKTEMVEEASETSK